MRRHELSEAQWAKIEPLVPRRGRKAVRGDRNFINAVLYQLKTGTPWRDLPERYGAWKTVYNRFANWAKRGHWKTLFEALKFEVDDYGYLIDASVVRAHQDAAGRKGGPDAMLWAALAEVFRPSSTRVSTPKAGRLKSTSRPAKRTR